MTVGKREAKARVSQGCILEHDGPRPSVPPSRGLTDGVRSSRIHYLGLSLFNATVLQQYKVEP